MARRHRLGIAWGLAGLAGLAGGFLLHVWAPSGGPESTICLMRRTVGLPCPGCGMTRALAALAKGEWAAAWRLHPFVYLIVFELGTLWLAAGLWILRRGAAVMGWVASPGLVAVVLVHVAAFLALWTGRLATGTLPW